MSRYHPRRFVFSGECFEGEPNTFLTYYADVHGVDWDVPYLISGDDLIKHTVQMTKLTEQK